MNRIEHMFYYIPVRGQDKVENLKKDIIAMVSRISDPKMLELLHRFLIRIMRDKKE